LILNTHTYVDGVRTFYSEYGEDQKKHVLFIHGLGSSSLGWGDAPEALSDHFHTIVVDLVGFGKSDKPEEDYTIGYFSKFIKNFLRQIGIKDQEKITIIGHSLGGYIAIDYAIENKDQLEKLVLIDSSGMLDKPTPLLQQYLNAALENDPILRYKKVFRIFEDLLAERSRLAPVRVDLFIGTIGESGAKHAFESAYQNSTTVSLDLKKLKQIKDIPCLIIWGEKDNLIPLDYLNKFENILNPKVEMIRDAGHAPHAEKPSIVYEKIRTFLI
jgi:pimeloyl-ACP methyl ester carboxylesterase